MWFYTFPLSLQQFVFDTRLLCGSASRGIQNTLWKSFRKLHTLSKMAALLHTYLRRINGDRWLEMCVQ